MKEPQRVPCYPLPPGLRPDDRVVLLHFDHGWWQVERVEDGSRFEVYMINVGAPAE